MGHDFLNGCHSKPKTLGELKVGDHFIVFPDDGDDSGHGGFRGGGNLMVKIEPKHPGEGYHESFLYTYRYHDKPEQVGSLPLWYPVIRVHGVT